MDDEMGPSVESMKFGDVIGDVKYKHSLIIIVIDSHPPRRECNTEDKLTMRMMLRWR